jgi:hypothetical protein
MEAPVVSPTAFPVVSCKGAAISRACSFLLRTWMVLPELKVKYNGQNYAGKINATYVQLKSILLHQKQKQERYQL